ncbi:MAG: hypothetical protein IJU16_08835 [Clostridia bacterium]|nr:hypothetical protein [Clostridia bacterium]
MKKVISLVLTLSMTLGLFVCVGPISLPSIVTAASYAAGDVNMDASVNTMDVRLVLRHIAGLLTLSDQQKSLADVDNDGKVDTADTRRIMNGLSTGAPIDTMVDINLLAPDIDDWQNPILETWGVTAVVAESKATDGATVFTNVGGTIWPYAGYVYDSKVLLPDSAEIEYDLTVAAASASINLYVGTVAPDLTSYSDPGRTIIKLNSLIGDTDEGSGDLLPGTYKGTISVSDLNVGAGQREGDNVLLSGIKLYVVGSYNKTGETVTIRKLQTRGYDEVKNVHVSTDPMHKVRTTLMRNGETDGLSAITEMDLYTNGELSDAQYALTTKDNKVIYRTESKQRVVNYPSDYQIDIPLGWTPDYSLSALRCQYSSDEYVLTVSRENKSTYGNTASGWNTYLTEWLNRFIQAPDSGYHYFFEYNNLSYSRDPGEKEVTINGTKYTIMTYDIQINNGSSWSNPKPDMAVGMPYYSIAIVRQSNRYNLFYLFVLKSTGPTYPMMDRIVRSFKPTTHSGTAVNSCGQYELKIPENWSDETKAYYNKIQNQTSVDWGFYTISIPATSDSSYTYNKQRFIEGYTALHDALDWDYEILPTYTHVSWSGRKAQFPLEMANEYAGGNGFNGKPVLQFTYQFTDNNNENLERYTPMFDILRGNYDATFRTMAQGIKEYGKPVLFRVNNEMNTDWTSYCGLVTLLDPDIFVKTWQRLYDIFEEEGVDNCIWIFNPISKSTPYCNWGEDLCYMPGSDYVQLIGLTCYEFGNGQSLSTFKNLYTELYNKNKNYYINYPWIISEFAAGAGGEKRYDWGANAWVDTELGRNQQLQAEWVNALFDCFDNNQTVANAFCKNIKAAVWFSANDYSKVDGKSIITNYLKLDEGVAGTIEVFKERLKNKKADPQTN